MTGEEFKPRPFCGEQPEITKYKTLQQIVDQLEWCNYQCEAGMLKMNTAFIALKKMALEAEQPAKDSEKITVEQFNLALACSNDNATDEQIARSNNDIIVQSMTKVIRIEIESYHAEKAAEDSRTIVNLSSDLLYIAGIVERGENRELHENETVPDAILTYVKYLETKSAECKSEEIESTSEPLSEMSRSEIQLHIMQNIEREVMTKYPKSNFAYWWRSTYNCAKVQALINMNTHKSGSTSSAQQCRFIGADPDSKTFLKQLPEAPR